MSLLYFSLNQSTALVLEHGNIDQLLLLFETSVNHHPTPHLVRTDSNVLVCWVADHGLEQLIGKIDSRMDVQPGPLRKLRTTDENANFLLVRSVHFKRKIDFGPFPRLHGNVPLNAARDIEGSVRILCWFVPNW